MIRAEILKITRRRGLMAFALFLSVGVLALFFGYNAIAHASDAAKSGPAGGQHNFDNAVQELGLFFGSLTAILVGAEAGSTDVANGVFRDMVVTGRPRLRFFLVRVPAAVLVSWAMIALAFALMTIACFVFAGRLPTPSASLILESGAWVLATNATLCIIAVGIASLTGSRAGTLAGLIGWQLIASRILISIDSLGSTRAIVPDAAFGKLKPGELLREGTVSMSSLAAVLVLIGWCAVWGGLGAWRTRTADA